MHKPGPTVAAVLVALNRLEWLEGSVVFDLPSVFIIADARGELRARLPHVLAEALASGATVRSLSGSVKARHAGRRLRR